MSRDEAFIRNREALVAFLQGSVKGRPYPYWLEVSDGRNRTREQNNLMWHWAEEVSTYTGESPAQAQARWKLDFGIKILASKSEKMRDMFESFKYQKPREWLLEMLEEPSSIAITRIMTVSEMNEFLEAIYMDENMRGHELTDPEGFK